MGSEGFRRQIAWLLLSLLTALLCSGPGFALDPRKAITQYVLDLWTTEDGLPQNSILAIAQTRDGYLWLGTWGGLARFDGVRFTVFDRENTREIESNFISALYEDRQGNLWIGTADGGLTRYKDGGFTSVTSKDELARTAVRSICDDREGNLWIGTGGGGLNRFRDGKFTRFTRKEGLSSELVYSVYVDREDNLWIGTSAGLNRFRDGKFTTYTTNEGPSNSTVQSIFEDREGGVWVGTWGGVYRFSDGKLTPYTPKEGLSNRWTTSIHEDLEGNLWVGTDGGGINRFKDGKFTSLTMSDGLSHNTVTSIYEDREGSLWLGTWGGLNRLKDGKFTVFAKGEGLSHDWTRCVYEDSEGSLWVGTHGGGLNRLKDSAFTHFTKKSGLSGNIVAAIYGDRQGNLWCPTEDGGLSRLKDGIFTDFSTRAALSRNGILTHYNPKANLAYVPASAIYEDLKGNLWIGTSRGGLDRLKDGALTHYSTKDGLSHDSITVINEDRKGNLWVGTVKGLTRFRDGKFTQYALKNGLPHITSIYEDPEGSLWMTTRGHGLIQFRDGELNTYTTREGLFDNVLTAVLEDGSRNLWIGSLRGIFCVRKQELEDVARGRTRVVNSVAYGTADGMRNVECNSHQPSGWKSKDGRLWFPTIKGLVAIDPDNAKLNKLAPPVLIEQVISDQRAIDHGQRAKLSPGRGELEFHFTALSFLDPKKVQFKYRLEGYDEYWIEAGMRRVAYYTNLSPGAYRFRVIASNNDGLWNETGATFDLDLLPHFYETSWFYALCIVLVVMVLLMLGSSVHHRRVRQLKAKANEQEAFSRQLIDSEESERKRIASELHDSLGQNLLVVKSNALIGLNMADDGSPAKKQFEEISTMTSQALEEVRKITHNLRPYHLDQLGLREALEFLLEKVAGSSEIRFSAEIDPIDGSLSKAAETNLYRIVQEGVNNIIKHSGATEARVALKRDGDRVNLMIEDNGRGFISRPGSAAESRRRGFGLIGISERARMLGGTELIHSVPGQGTTITITVMFEEERHED